MVSIFKNMDIETNKAIHTISVVTKEDVFYFNANSRVFSNSTVYTSLDNQYSVKVGNRICNNKLVIELTIMGIPKQNLIEKVIVDNNVEYVLEQHVGNIFTAKEVNNIDLTLGFVRDNTSFNNIKNVYSCEEYISICSRFIQQVRIDGMAIVSLNNYKIAKMIYHSKQVDKETDLITRIEDNRLIVGFLTKNKINDIHELDGYKVYDVIQGKSNHDLLVLHKTGFIHCKVNVKGIEIVNNLDGLFVLEDNKDYLITLNMNTFGFSEVTSSDSFITFEGKSFEELSVMLSDLDPEKLKLKDRDSIKALKMLINDSKQVVNVLKMSGFLGDNDNSKDNPFCLEPKNLGDIKYSFELVGKEIHLMVDKSIKEIENTTQESLLEIDVKGKEVNDLVEATNKELIQSIEVFKDNLKELDREYRDKEKSLEQVIKEANFAYVRLTSKIDSAEDYISNFNRKLDTSLSLADQKLETKLTNFSKEVGSFIKQARKDLENTVEGLLDKFYSDLDLFYEDKSIVETLIEKTLGDLENLNKEYSNNLLELKNKYLIDLDNKNTESLTQIEERKDISIDSIHLERDEALNVIKASTQGVVDLVEGNVEAAKEYAESSENSYREIVTILEGSEKRIEDYTNENIQRIDSKVEEDIITLNSIKDESNVLLSDANKVLAENKAIESSIPTKLEEHKKELGREKEELSSQLTQEKEDYSEGLRVLKEELREELSTDFQIETEVSGDKSKLPDSFAIVKYLENFRRLDNYKIETNGESTYIEFLASTTNKIGYSKEHESISVIYNDIEYVFNSPIGGSVLTKEYLESLSNGEGKWLRESAYDWWHKKNTSVDSNGVIHSGLDTPKTTLNESNVEKTLTANDNKIPSSGAVVRALEEHKPNYHISSNGNVKESGPILKLFSNGIEPNGEFSVAPVFNKIDEGVYEISNTNGLASKGWFIETPKDINGMPIYYVKYTQDTNKVVTIYVYNTIKHNPDSKEWEESGLVDIDERLGWIDLRFDS